MQKFARLAFGLAIPLTTLLVASACASAARSPTNAGMSNANRSNEGTGSDDPYLWLEEVEGASALDWVRTHNEKSQTLLTGDPRYASLYDQVHSILVAKDRIPTPSLQGGWVYNFWQDTDHVKGLWRRARPAEFAKAEPAWETILDVDALSAQEHESWVWKGATCLPPTYQKCLISLSRGGKDAVVIREFDTERHAFVADGFNLPEAKSDVAWMDDDTIWIGTDFGPGSLTHSGYPRIVKLWRRGTLLTQATQVFEGTVDDVSANGYTYFAPGQAPLHILSRSPSFFESEQSIYTAGGKIIPIPFPRDADFKGVYQGQAMAVLRSNFIGTHDHFSAGTLVSIPVSQLLAGGPKPEFETVYAPDNRSTLSGLSWTSDALYLDVLQNVKGRLLKVQRSGAKWKSARLSFPDNGSVVITAADPFGKDIFASYESFLVPTTLYAYDGGKAAPRALKSLPARFDASGYQVEQYESVSKDGTKIPYFMIHKKGMPLDSNQPTLLYGYGGFEVSEVPFYSGTVGKAWLERGGVYVLANIRGGGEFGPKWHEAAILQNRQKAYDDFISVGADLFRRHITQPSRLGIMGGSNGGLLMGVMFTQRPDLFKAVVCQVPLLDMLRYHKLLAGASWMGEYGNPDEPAMAAVIGRYSPYQNVHADLRYPRVYFETSTKDDRVHPGHARKMVAKMEAQGHEVIYFENMEGGHSAAADLEQRAKRTAMEFAYLWNELTGAPAAAIAPAASGAGNALSTEIPATPGTGSAH